MSKPDGGRAFPQILFKKDSRGYMVPDLWKFAPGMTLRQKYAEAAMQGDWASQNDLSGVWMNEVDEEVLSARAALYFRMADAMLAHERKEEDQ